MKDNMLQMFEHSILGKTNEIRIINKLWEDRFLTPFKSRLSNNLAVEWAALLVSSYMRI